MTPPRDWREQWRAEMRIGIEACQEFPMPCEYCKNAERILYLLDALEGEHE